MNPLNTEIHDVSNEDKLLRAQNSETMKAVLWPYTITGALVAILCPEALVQSSLNTTPLAAAESLGYLFPVFVNLPRATTFPATTTLFLLVMSTGLVPVACMLAKRWQFHRRMTSLRKSDQQVVLCSGLFIAILSIVLITQFPSVSVDEIRDQGGRGGWLVSFLTQSRIGIALIGSTFFAIAATASGVTAALWSLIYRNK